MLRLAPKGAQGLTPVATPEQLRDLARSDEPADVKKDIAVSFLLAHQQNVGAELRARLQSEEKENGKLHRQLVEVREEVGTLKGDVRVLTVQLKAARADRSKRTFYAALGSVVFSFAGGFFGTKQWLPASLFLLFGGALFYLTWFHDTKSGDETV